MTHFKNFQIIIKMSSLTYDRGSCDGLQIIDSKSQFSGQCINRFKIKFVNFARFICLFRQTHTNNRETLCSWVCAFVFHFNLLHHLVLLGPKSISQRRLGSSRQRIMGRTIEKSSVQVSYSRADLRDPCLFANFSHINQGHPTRIQFKTT